MKKRLLLYVVLLFALLSGMAKESRAFYIHSLKNVNLEILTPTIPVYDSMVNLSSPVFTNSVEFPDTACFSINDQLVLDSCNGNQVTLSAPEGYDSYRWNNGSTSSTATYTVNDTTTASCLVSTTDCQFTLIATLLTQSGQPTVNSVIYDTICEGESYTDNYFNLPPQNVIGTNIFRNTFYNINTCSGGCLTTTLYLTVRQRYFDYNDVACEGQDYNRYGLSLSNLSVGKWEHGTTIFGNDDCYPHYVMLHLRVYPTFNISNSITGDSAVCRNDNFTYILPNANNLATFHWNVPEGVNVHGGQETPAVSLSFTDEAPNPAQITVIGTHLCGIDSVSFNVTHFPVYNIVIQDSICIGDEYHRYGFDLARQDSVGMFTHTNSDTSIHGCDSVVTLQLKVNQIYAVSDSMTICDSELPYFWNGVEFAEAGTQTAILQTVSGCDSVVTMVLTVNYTATSIDKQVTCDSMTWLDGMTYYASTTSPTYTYTGAAANGCDSIVSLHLTVKYTAVGIDEQVACDSMTWLDGVTYYASTTSPTYTYPGAAANGCDSVVTLHLTMNYSSHNVFDTFACESYTWHDSTYAVTGTYTYAYTNAYGCASVDTLHLTVNYGTHNVYDSIVCESFAWHDSTYTVTGTYTYAYTNADDCASVDTLHLTVNYTAMGIDEQVACDSLTWLDGVSYYASTNTPTFTYEGGAANGCDSIVSLHLTVNYTVSGVDEQVACDSLTWLDGVTYYASTNTPTYTYYGGAANSCDSVVILHLTVNYTATGVDEQVACDSLTWLDSVTYYASTNTPTYTYEGGAANGCDSVVTLNLTMNYTSTGIDEQVACDSLTWLDGVTYYASTNTPTYTYEGGAANGCDSIVSLHLTVKYTAMGIDEQVACDSMTWLDGVTYYTSTTGPTYTYPGGAANGCDSIVNLHLTVNYTVTAVDEQTACDSLTWLDGVTYYASTTSPTYTYSGGAANGCDSVVNLHLTVNQTVMGVDEQVACDSLTWLDGVTYYTSTTSPTYTYSGGAVNGCDSVVNLHLTVNQAVTGVDEQVACDSLTWLDGVTYYTSTTSPTYTYSGGAANGCDSVVTLHLTINPSYFIEDTLTICETELPYTYGDTVFEIGTASMSVHYIHNTTALACDSVTLLTIELLSSSYKILDTIVLENDLPLRINDSLYYVENTYTQTMPNADVNGCDSVLTINMTVLYNDTVYADTTICDNDFPFTWNGVVFTTAGTQSVVYTATDGADSMVVMTVNYNPTTYGFLDTTVLQNDLPFVCYGESYSIPGIYTQTIENAAGCDSVVTINLEEIYNVVAFADTVVCAINTPFEWNGYIFRQTATQMVILPASTGADSMLVMTVTVVYTTYGSLDTTVVENDLPFVLNGESYMTQGYKIQMLSNHAGCDSILTINLHILYNVTVPADSTVCESELPVIWNGQSFDAEDIHAATHTIIHSALLTASTGVDSTVVMTVHVNPSTYGTLDTTIVENALPLVLDGETYPAAGIYTKTISNSNVYECDSVLAIHLSVLNNVTVHRDSILCQTELPLTWNGITFTLNTTDPFVTPIILLDSTILTASTGVDSTVVMTVVVNPTTYGTMDTTILENDLPLLLNGQSYVTDSIFSQTLIGVNSNGCDSVLTVNMTVLYNVTVNVDSVICETELPLTWNGVTFVSDSIHQDSHSFTQSAVLTASTGVDSIVVMTVHVLYATTGIDEQVACDSYTWINGITYTASTNTPIFTIDGGAANGCDSVVVLHLTIYHSALAQDTLVLVENQLPYYFSVADTVIALGAPAESQFSYHLFTIHDCDSTIEQTVIVHYNTSETVDTTVCASSLPYIWHGHQFAQAGSYTDTLHNENGSLHYLTMQLAVSAPAVTMQNTHHVTCYGGSNGSVGVLVNDGTQPYGCHWENVYGATVSSTAQLNNQSAGKYRLFVTDALGCQVVDSVTLIHLNDSMVPGIIASNQGVCEGTHLQTFTGTTALGGAGSVYQWQIFTDGTTWSPAPTPNNSQNYNYPQPVNSPFSLRRAWMSTACGTVFSNVVNITVYHADEHTIFDEVCQGYPYQDYGFDIAATATTTPGVLPCSIHLQNVHGCDSLVTLLLTVNPSLFAEESITICQNELPYTYNDTTFLPGTPQLSTFSFQLSTYEGCDSIVTLHLTVNPSYDIELNDIVCEGDDY
jgi:hypothetical protein